MGRSNSRSHSSRSKSRSRSSSRSRSRSHSRKKRYSSRSRSRTYSRSRSRERMYSRDNRDSRDSRDMRDMRDNRDYHRDFRNNRGMRRPYGFRPMRRGFFPGGGGGRFMHRGGFRPMWNRRYSRSPRRDRSRSRTPKRRSVSSQRSRSRSRRSYRSSRSPMSSSSGSSSQCSKSSPVRAKKRVSREKKLKKSRTAPLHDSPLNNKPHDEQKDTFERDPSESLDEFSKASGVCGDTWAGLSAYDNSPGSPRSPSLVASPSTLSSSDSDTPIVTTAKDPSSPRSHSIQHSPESVNNGSARYSPTQNSPLRHVQSKKSPAKTILAEESRAGELESTKVGKPGKRYTDEEARIHLLDRGSTREKAQQKERVLEKVRKEAVRDWEDLESLDYFNDKATKNKTFLNVSEGEDFDEIEDYRQFRKSVLAEQGKTSASTAHWNAEEEGTKLTSKLLTKDSRDADLFREEKPCRAKEASQVREKASTSTEKEDWDSEKVMLRKSNQSPDELKSEKLKDLFNYSPLHKMVSKEKSSFREESPFGIRMVASESHHPEVKLKMTTEPLEADRSTSLLNDRLIASTLVHSVNKDQEFRSIFDHLKLPQSGKTSSESFIDHVVSLVHYVQEHCFKSSEITLHERFGGYQKATKEQTTLQKSPEIHRRIDISPSALKKHTRLAGEEKSFKEIAPKQTDKKFKITSTDKRHEVERRRKQRSKERGSSKGSRESSSSRKQDKLQKEYKEFKLFKEESKRKNKEKERSQSTSSSSSSPEDKNNKKEQEEDFRIQQEQKEFSGFSGVSRPRGTFFRIRGRGRARGLFAGTNAGPITLNPPPFPKRPPEEEWDPEYTPKSKKYFLHDDRDDGVDYWANRGRGRGTFQRGRGRFTFKKSGSSPKWTHDKYQGDGLLEDEEEAMENNEERMDIRTEEKD